MSRTDHPLPANAADLLLPLARSAIATALGLARAVGADTPWLRAPGASFVTLKQGAALRGCIGSLLPQRALGDDVRANAVAAALHDPRFAPLTVDELERTLIEVSLLSPAQALPASSEPDALARLRPGVDGLVLEYGGLRATFLPQVWAQLPTPVDFLRQLKRKTGLPADFWHAELRLSRYTVSHWQEAETPSQACA